MRRFVLPVVALGLVAVAVAVGAALATPPVGVVAQNLVRGTLLEPGDKSQLIHAIMRGGVGQSDVLVQRITVEPGGQFGWHQHPGPAIVTVLSGTLTLYYGNSPTCAPLEYPAGTAFVDPGHLTHNARNEGSSQLEFYATYIIPPADAPRIDVPTPPGNCPF